MIEDMTLAGLADRTQQAYIGGVRGLAAHYHLPPDQLREDQVRAYLLGLRDKGVARGTFKTSHFGIRFLYVMTRARGWALFDKKRFARRSRSACQKLYPTTKSASFWVM